MTNFYPGLTSSFRGPIARLLFLFLPPLFRLLVPKISAHVLTLTQYVHQSVQVHEMMGIEPGENPTLTLTLKPWTDGFSQSYQVSNK